jgi:hypothetical protein
VLLLEQRIARERLTPGRTRVADACEVLPSIRLSDAKATVGAEPIDALERSGDAAL